MSKIRFGIAGSGWRAEFYLRVARACGDRFEVTGITSRSDKKRAQLEQKWGIPAFASVRTLIETGPQFVVTSVAWEANPGIIMELAQAGVPVLSETPPAPDITGLQRLNHLGARIQVAEQYHLQPLHAARIAAAASGRLGPVTQAQVSAAHGYHGISLMRRLLGIGFEPCVISAASFTSSIVAGPDRSGPPSGETVRDSDQQLAWFDFPGKLGVFDFTGDQYFSWIRNERILVRGERGEIMNRQLTYLKDYRTPINLEFVRHEAGEDGNLEGNFLKGLQLGEEWVYTNPLVPAALTDEEIAVGTCLLRMADYVETGKEFYSLAEASQDHYLGLKMQEAIDRSATVEVPAMTWKA